VQPFKRALATLRFCLVHETLATCLRRSDVARALPKRLTDLSCRTWGATIRISSRALALPATDIAMTSSPAAEFPALSIGEAHARLTAPGARYEMEERLIRGIPTRIWKNAPSTMRDVFVTALGHGERTFVLYEEERITYRAFTAAVLELAHALRAEGLQKGDRVALVMRNLPEWPVAYFAVALCGAIVAPLNAWWTGHELEYTLRDSGAAFAIVDDERLDRIEPLLESCPALQHVYVARSERPSTQPKVRPLEQLVPPVSAWSSLAQRPIPDVAIDPEDDLTIFYTSGTTGKPKGAVGTHRNATTNIFTQGCATARSFLRRGEEPPVPSPTDPQRVSLLVVPMFHVTGCNASLIPAVNLGSKLVLMRKWDAEKAMQLIERERITSAGGVPTIAWQLIEHPARDKYDLSSLEYVSYGGAPAAPELVRRIREVFPSAKAGNGWGMTETSGTFSTNSSEDYERKPDSCGPPAPVGDAKIMNIEGTSELPTGEVGELWVRGPQVIRGYWQMPEATAQTFVNGWVRTGDLARIDDEGFTYIVDRAKDILIRGGENIYCIQVESALYEHPAVMDAAVVGIPHRTLGEEPGAVVHLRPGSQASEDELKAFVAARLAAFEVPVRVLFWPEPLPRNPAGKIMKRDLKSAFAS
jgi:long-chain acyl-CoA synthetase